MKLPWSRPMPWKIQIPPARQHITPNTDSAMLIDR